MEERERKLRSALVLYGVKLVEEGLVQGTWGNLSARLDDTHMLVTPSGLDYTRLNPDDMVKVNYYTLEWEGIYKPTSEKGLHAVIYRNRKDVMAIIHTHSKYCSIFASARKDMPISLTEAQAVFGNIVACSKYGLPGTDKLTENTVKGLSLNMGTIMANHGMVACGKDISEAFKNCGLLEKNGEIYIENKYKVCNDL